MPHDCYIVLWWWFFGVGTNNCLYICMLMDVSHYYVFCNFHVFIMTVLVPLGRDIFTMYYMYCDGRNSPPDVLAYL